MKTLNLNSSIRANVLNQKYNILIHKTKKNQERQNNKPNNWQDLAFPNSFKNTRFFFSHHVLPLNAFGPAADQNKEARRSMENHRKTPEPKLSWNSHLRD
jgi:hypothetical protein